MQVLEHTLKVSGDALIDGDFDAFASIFHLPHVLSTFEGTTTLETPQDLHAVFKTVTKRFASLGVTAIVRECIAADRKAEDLIEATHTSRFMAGSQQVNETSSAFSELRLFEGVWLGTSSQYAIAEDMNLSRALIICTGRGIT